MKKKENNNYYYYQKNAKKKALKKYNTWPRIRVAAQFFYVFFTFALKKFLRRN